MHIEKSFEYIYGNTEIYHRTLHRFMRLNSELFAEMFVLNESHSILILKRLYFIDRTLEILKHPFPAPGACRKNGEFSH